MKKISSLLGLLIFAFLIYSGFKLGMPYYRYAAFKSDVKEIAKLPLEDELLIAGMRSRVFERAKELKIPIEKEDIKVTRTDGIIAIKTSWSEVVDIFGAYQKTLSFNIDIKE